MPENESPAEDLGFKASAAADDLHAKKDGVVLKAKPGFRVGLELRCPTFRGSSKRNIAGC
jgi:hypothetical protein